MAFRFLSKSKRPAALAFAVLGGYVAEEPVKKLYHSQVFVWRVTKVALEFEDWVDKHDMDDRPSANRYREYVYWTNSTSEEKDLEDVYDGEDKGGASG